MTDVLVYVVRKQCYLCGKEWDGKSFVPQPADGPRLPGMCADCLAIEEASMQELLAQGPVTESGKVLPPLKRPLRPPEDDEPDWHAKVAP